MKWIINCTLISNFAAVHRLDLLHIVLGSLQLPVEVYHEILNGRLSGYDFYDTIEQHITPFTSEGWLQLVTMTGPELQLATSLPAHLHPGERACLCIARHRGWGLLTDDLDARRQAHLWQIPLSGTLGVLLLAVQERHLDIESGNALLAAMVHYAHYRTPTNDLAPLL